MSCKDSQLELFCWNKCLQQQQARRQCRRRGSNIDSWGRRRAVVLDPAQSREAQFVQYFQPVFDTLIRRTPDGQPGPMLAKSWSYNADNTELSFVLRDDVKFSDGEAFNAAAAKANLDRFKTAGGPLQAQLVSLESVTAKDATTLVLTLSTQDPSLIVNLGGPSGYMQSPSSSRTPTLRPSQ
ncbi:ABC transporter substrate-binding protein [Arthrobacter alpinus]|nr:ABC transporter substrate-binding protein [Arthrobacter alpinus]